MTNKEILQADLLDILFENRNKAYGAYALRKNYNHRLQWALGISLGLVLFLISLLYKKKNSDQPMFERTEFILPTYKQPDKPKPLNQPKPPVEPQRAQTKYVNQISIVKDKIDMPDQAEISTALISDKTRNGLPTDEAATNSNNSGNGNEKTNTNNEPVEPKKKLPSYDAQYPGGREAFAEFLKKYLNTP